MPLPNCRPPVRPPGQAGALLRPAPAGFTLIEVMMAAIVLALAITTAITTLQRGLQSVDTARGLTFASQAMQSEFERLRLKSWEQIEALQNARDTTVTVAGTPPATAFTCTRTITNVKTDMKEITLEANWRGHDGRPHSVRFVTRYGRSGLYDYFHTSH